MATRTPMAKAAEAIAGVCHAGGAAGGAGGGGAARGEAVGVAEGVGLGDGEAVGDQLCEADTDALRLGVAVAVVEGAGEVVGKTPGEADTDELCVAVAVREGDVVEVGVDDADAVDDLVDVWLRDGEAGRFT
jgi:hypothetical protein